jgi:D-arginine dehydrogenase
MERFDIVVIGGGIAGASTAMHLAESASVLLVETEGQLARHSTGRSAAMTNRTSGPPAVCALADASRTFLESPPEGFAQTPLLTPRGLLWVGARGTEQLLEITAAKAPGTTSRLRARECRSLVPLLRPEPCGAGGVHEPSAMAIDVAALLEGYRRGLLARGGLIRTDAEAVELRHRGGVWQVVAGPYAVECPTIVNAAGAWGDEVARRADVRRLRLRTLRRTAVLVDAPSSVATTPMVMDVEGRWYAVADSGGLLISASDETPDEPRDVRAEELDVALAIERITDAFELEVRGIRRSWAGLRTFTEDRVPALGPDPDEPSFVWAVGQGGAGIKTAPALAATVADAVLRGVPVPDALNVARLRR